MRTLFSLTLFLVSSSISPAQEAPVVSPRGSYTISQQQNESWTTTLHFAHTAHPDVSLEGQYPWPALYISPDDRWMRMERDFGELAFHWLDLLPGLHLAELYHTGIEFHAWDMREGSLRFSIHGSSVEKSGQGVEREIIYDLHKHQFHTPKA